MLCTIASSVVLAGLVAAQSSAALGPSATVSSSSSPSRSATGSAASASSSGAFLQALQSNSQTSAFGQALANVNSVFGVQRALNGQSPVTVFVPPAAALQQLTQNTLVSNIFVNVNGTNATFVDALLAYHVANGSYPASAILQALQQSSSGVTLTSYLQGVPLDVYGVIASGSTGAGQPAAASSASGSASASASGAAAAPATTAQTKIFVDNAEVVGGNVVQSNGKIAHLIDRPLDPLFVLLGLTELPSTGGQVIAPSAIASASASVSIAPLSSSSAASAGAAGATSTGSSAQASSLPTAASATARMARWL